MAPRPMGRARRAGRWRASILSPSFTVGERVVREWLSGVPLCFHERLLVLAPLLLLATSHFLLCFSQTARRGDLLRHSLRVALLTLFLGARLLFKITLSLWFLSLVKYRL